MLFELKWGWWRVNGEELFDLEESSSSVRIVTLRKLS
jgi:hypothetical protein